MSSNHFLRQVDEGDTAQRIRQNLTTVMEVLEAFSIVFEDGIEINPEAAEKQLEEAKQALAAAYVDTFGDSQEHDLTHD